MHQPIALPPGIKRQNTEYQAGGAWWDADKVRWYGDQVGPIGGWRKRSSSAVSGMARALLPWKTTALTRFIAIGTHTNLYVQNDPGALYDITPAGLAAGHADETANTGFGSGVFGHGAFGTPRPDTGTRTDALVWDLDVFADLLVACAFSDGRIFGWSLDTSSPAAPIAGAPVGCSGVVVTEQGFVMALGAGGDPRRIQWSDQADATEWAPSATNQAGDIGLVTAGTIRKGLKLGELTLILTDLDAHVGEYLGLPLVYRFRRAGYGCGALSKGCAVAMGAQAVWWSGSGFWTYDGSVHPIECDVWDFLARNLNQGQRSKISGFHNSQFGEVWWFYPSAASTENDSYVVWDYRRGHWNIGTLARLCAAEPSVFRYVLAMDTGGFCHEHEVGFDYEGATPFAETGPIELGAGDQIMRCVGIAPDERTAGEVSLSFRTRNLPDGAETVLPDAVLDEAGFSELRFAARQARLRITGAADTAWRFGRPRLELQPGGRR